MKSAAIVFAATFGLVHTAYAGSPTGKLVMLDVDKLSNVNLTGTGNTQLTWRELVEAGINGVQFRSWTQLGDPSLTQAGWVEQAHEYGMWVCGGTGHDVDYMVPDVAYLAEIGVDFIQLDEPMGHGLTESGYHQVRNSARAVKQDTPVIITDVFYTDTIAAWSGVDGIMQEVYVDNWFPSKRQEAVAYRDSHPGADVFMWVWLLTNHPDSCAAYPDSKFDTWFNDSFTHLGKVLLFIFTQRAGVPGGTCEWGTNWGRRVETIKASTAPYRAPLPEWRNFAPVGETGTGVPDVSIEVQSASVGLDPASVEAFYTVDGGQVWVPWPEVTCTGDRGTTGWQTITANNVPFSQVSSTLNKVRFKITDTYSGTYYRSARTDTAEFTVNVDRLQWNDFNPGNSVADPTPDCSVHVDDPGGLDVGSAACEYSTDGSQSWSAWPVEATGDANGLAITARDVPFLQESSSLNRIRFSIRNNDGEKLDSRSYPVRVAMPPLWSEFSPRYTDNLTPDCRVVAGDENGLVVGAAEQAPAADTALLLHLNDAISDSSGNGVPVTGSGGLQWTSTDTWKSIGGQENMLRFDGNDDYVVSAPLVIETGEITMMAWVQATDPDEAMAYGGVEEQGSFLFRFGSDSVTVAGRAGGSNLSLRTPPGSFAYDGEWYHVAGVVSGEEVALYVNGVPQAEATWSGFQLAVTKPVSLGRAMNRTRYFGGIIDDVSVSRRALSAEEVLFAHASGLYRYSRDGGSTWEIDWTPCDITPVGGSANAVAMTAFAVPFAQLSETDNVIRFVIRDGNGNLAVENFVVKITETGIDPCAGKECGDGCGDCAQGDRCDEYRCVSEDSVESTESQATDNAIDMTLVGGCSAGPMSIPLPWMLAAVVVVAARRRGR